jgi:hypothetical protein
VLQRSGHVSVLVMCTSQALIFLPAPDNIAQKNADVLTPGEIITLDHSIRVIAGRADRF